MECPSGIRLSGCILSQFACARRWRVGKRHDGCLVRAVHVSLNRFLTLGEASTGSGGETLYAGVVDSILTCRLEEGFAMEFRPGKGAAYAHSFEFAVIADAMVGADRAAFVLPREKPSRR